MFIPFPWIPFLQMNALVYAATRRPPRSVKDFRKKARYAADMSQCAECFIDLPSGAIITRFTIETTPSMELKHGEYVGIKSSYVSAESEEGRTSGEW
jgi:hypothetical protein